MSPKALAEAWVKMWSQTDSAAFAALFDEAIDYTDNAFNVSPQGREAVQDHHRIWLAAAPDFSIELEELHELGNIVVVQGLGRGTFNGEDLANGTLKATGKPFQGRLAAVIICGENGIVKCDEYYDRLQMPGMPA